MLAHTALEVEYRHLSYFSGPFVMIALADPKVPAEEKEAMARKLLGLLDTWEPRAMSIRDRVFPDLRDEKHWKVMCLILYLHLQLHLHLHLQDSQGNKCIPGLDTPIDEDSFLIFDHLGWKKEDMKIFRLPFNR